ncbi:inorganic phosphate transporter [Pseudoflavonifractor sp. MSJ-37]|uniref:inorganic phosphate transporter n=1 Tax=Pseudoflavonifractor sp. MSJ-37 TaxID=2841531 RepID=UPI0020A08889|nr:inorganic phosphate transporter [Pseudoflavonifractor sp. MSJ-37]
MSPSCLGFLSQALHDPGLALVSLLALSVLMVNGWTDAPNAIAAAVASGALPFRRAVLLAAAGDLAGSLCAALWCPAVARTVRGSVDLGRDPTLAYVSLCAALAAVSLWAVLAWTRGLPTSESHALLAGLAGASLAGPGGWDALRPGPWCRVLAGLSLSLLLGAWGGRKAGRLLRRHPWPEQAYRLAQIPGAAAMAFLHGAQDGQKLLAIFLLGTALSQGRWGGEASVPAWLAVLCAAVMALGTLLGGRRIVEKLGGELIPLSPAAGTAADLGGGAVLLLCTLLGLPVSTTHTKAAAILGAGQAFGGRADRSVVRSLLLAWGLTFPCCGLLAFLLARSAL